MKAIDRHPSVGKSTFLNCQNYLLKQYFDNVQEKNRSTSIIIPCIETVQL